ncbi:MAG: hypothetical protein IPG90_09710 [Bacteroidetes bacterium]|nr:hypothetical protein [Bacteroidota bacterium]MBK6838508.1 hypothetical protein [Bacteroidota bacterium]MBP6402190.1 hypothetical protein [Bacteroidia bacterium]
MKTDIWYDRLELNSLYLEVMQIVLIKFPDIEMQFDSVKENCKPYDTFHL